MNKNEALTHLRVTFSRFYLGLGYPVLIGALVFLGHAFAVELYLLALSVTVTSLGLVLTRRARPLVFFVISFVYQVSRKNAPGIPEPSDYYFTSWRLLVLILLIAILLGAVIYYAARVRLFAVRGLKKTPLLIPLATLSLSFITNGAFSGKWNSASLIFGVMEALCYTVLFVFFYHVLLREDDGLVDYFVYCSAVLAVVITLEVLWCYIAQENPVKENLLFGWGIWNTAGVALTVLVPTSLLGFAKGKIWYLPVAGLTLLGAFLSMSRNAMLVGAVVTVISLAVMAAYGKRRIFALVTLGVGAVSLIGIFIIFGEGVLAAASSFLNDNGRYEIWRMGIENFLSAPLFGVGFFGADFGTFFTADFLPTMAHQTFIQLLSAMGVFGLSAYLFYRGATLVPFIKNHSFEKTALAVSILALLLESMLDNFVFYFLPTLHYTVLLAVVFVVYNRGRQNNH